MVSIISVITRSFALRMEADELELDSAFFNIVFPYGLFYYCILGDGSISKTLGGIMREVGGGIISYVQRRKDTYSLLERLNIDLVRLRIVRTT